MSHYKDKQRTKYKNVNTKSKKKRISAKQKKIALLADCAYNPDYQSETTNNTTTH